MAVRHADRVGTFITTKQGIELKIIDHNGRCGNDARHLFYCEICAKDPELFGDGCFWSRVHSITHKGSLPCGCARNTNWTESQDYVRCKRAAERSGLLFTGWRESYKGYNTKLLVACPTHGEGSVTTTVNGLVNGSSGCRKCYEQRIREGAMSDEDASKKYLPICGYPDGSSLRRLGEPLEGSDRSLFEVYCPTCANDEFAKAGLCSGKFTTDSASLCTGYRACRCGSTKRKPEKIARYQCESLLKDSGIDFMGWVSGYQNGRSKMAAKCPDHGIFYPSMLTVLRGSRCPACCFGGYSVTKPGSLYLLASKCKTMMKVGISNNFNERRKTLIWYTPFEFSELAVKDMQGPAAPVLERKILERSKRLGLTGFNGSSEWFQYDEAVLDYFR